MSTGTTEQVSMMLQKREGDISITKRNMSGISIYGLI